MRFFKKRKSQRYNYQKTYSLEELSDKVRELEYENCWHVPYILNIMLQKNKMKFRDQGQDVEVLRFLHAIYDHNELQFKIRWEGVDEDGVRQSFLKDIELC